MEAHNGSFLAFLTSVGARLIVAFLHCRVWYVSGGGGEATEGNEKSGGYSKSSTRISQIQALNHL